VGVTLEQVKEATGFELIVPDTIPTTPPPTEVELKILREQVDPLRLVIGR
jgi:glutaconate CoA-transferase subunit B